MTRPIKKGLKYLTILILIIGSVFLLKEITLEIMYPRMYKEEVEKYAEENELDPLLVYAIIKTESNFNPKAISSSSAIGLMQLLESTAKEKSQKVGKTIQSAADLYNPDTNIKLGCAYFAELLQIFKGNLPLTIAAYNAGIGNVNNWIKEGIIKEDGMDIENIPFKETNSYVRKILRNYDIYKNIYQK